MEEINEILKQQAPEPAKLTGKQNEETDSSYWAEVERRREEIEEEQNRFNFQTRLKESMVGKRYQNCYFEELERCGIPDIVRENYKIVKQYATELEKNIEEGNSLILRGPVGVMKTTMAVAVLLEQLRSGGRGLFITMASLLDTIFTLKDTNKQEWARFENDLRTAKVIVIDDLGAEYNGSDWVKTKIDSIISERYNNCLPVIITTNLKGEELKRTYAERIMDRLRSTAIDVVFEGKSLRGKKEA